MYSFESWCIDNNRIDILDLWDYELNEKLPSEIGSKSNNKYWFKCDRGIHDSEKHDIQYFPSGRTKYIKCKKCGSFAQRIIDEYGIDYFKKIWNDKNILNPWDEQYGCNKKIIINCLNNSNHVYESNFHRFSSGERCPYCAGLLVDKNNSLGSNVKNIMFLWSDKNTKTPFEFSEYSTKIVYWRCKNKKHNDYKRKISISHSLNFRCPECSKENIGIEKRNDLTNKVFGELKVICIDEEKTKLKNKTFWKCVCSCGTIKSIYGYGMTSGNIVTCGDKSFHKTGENSPTWKGGKTPELILGRNNSEYKKWRDSVYKKDWYTCQCCGKFKDIEKNAHHINNFSSNTEYRYDVSNGITLCKDCHYTTVKGSFHNIYGTTNNDAKQLEDYINSKRKVLGINIDFSISSYLNGNILKPIKQGDD